MKSYDEIFQAYVTDLREAKTRVDVWWGDLMAAASPAGNFDEAQQRVRPRWPAGAVSHPWIVHVVRHYFLAVDSFNEERAEANDSPDDAESLSGGWGETDEFGVEDEEHLPQDILFDRLEREDLPLRKFMQHFVLMPIGERPRRSATVSDMKSLQFATRHDVGRGIRKLMSAPRDLPGSAPWVDPPLSRRDASAHHREAYERYLQDLSAALVDAETRWTNKLRKLMDRGANQDEAMKQQYARQYAGPAAEPGVIWTVRTYWLECTRINLESPEAKRVPPEVFLLHWLVQDGHSVAVQVLIGMPYWPIGLDTRGNWT